MLIWSKYAVCNDARSHTNGIHCMLTLLIHIQSNYKNYNLDSNMKSSNYMKIGLKALIYFELQQTLKLYF